jgi:hypothetical protein
LIVTSNKPFGRWGEVFGDEVVAAAMIDRLVHHAEVVSLRGDSYRLKRPRPRPPHQRGQRRPMTNPAVNFTCRQGVSFRLPLTCCGSGMTGRWLAAQSLALVFHEAF